MTKKKKITKDRHEESPKKVPEQEEEGYGQFGGLPDRDLKRNLGCG